MCGPNSERCWHLPAHLLATLAILAASSACPSSAFGAEDKAAAREHYATGTRLYEVREYAKALEEYKAAYVAKADPAFLFNIGQCLRKMDRNEEALDFFQQYLKKAPTDDPNRAQVEARIRNIKAGRTSAYDPFEQSDTAKSARPPAVEVTPSSVSSPPSPPEAVMPAPPPVPEVKPAPVSEPAAQAETLRPLTTWPSGLAPQTVAQPLPANPGAQPAGLDLATSPRASEDHASTPIYRTWWFWTGIGAVVVAGTVTAIALSSSGGGTTIPNTTLGPRSVP